MNVGHVFRSGQYVIMVKGFTINEGCDVNRVPFNPELYTEAPKVAEVRYNKKIWGTIEYEGYEIIPNTTKAELEDRALLKEPEVIDLPDQGNT